MAKLAFIADVHVGNPTTFGGPVVCGVNDRGRRVLHALRAAVEVAQGCDALVICGDLFDTSSPSPQLISEVQRILDYAPRAIVLLGNHDMVSTTDGDNALGPMHPLPNVQVAQEVDVDFIKDTALLSIPFMPGDCREWFAPAVEEAVQHAAQFGPAHKRVLAFHLGVIDKETPAFLREAHDAIPLEVVQEVMERHGISYAYCGNWHSPKRWGQIIQCGALVPTGWDNPGWDYGQVHVLDTVTGHTSIRHIPGPRFLTVTSKAQLAAASLEAQQRHCDLYLTLKGEAADEVEHARAQGYTCRVVADTTEAKAATKAAAVAVKQAGTLQEALARYVAEMPVADGVERMKVQALAAKYLTRS